MSYTVRILPVAAQERRRIFDYIHDRSPQSAESWEAAYEAALTRLEKDPQIYGLAEESNHFDFALRQLLFRTRSGLTYRLLFRVDEDQVTIYRLRGPGQAPLKDH
ncbi:type II toxin-antitoxin system RelE/ParE family toxin [Bythopirellula goksoeyrii]|uniref:Plasmid stabilization system protein n=1 Tax=Bythopirellula goksoeyrii TaxID=1400387 RepID=A0A5B9QBW0_9BACT|nr:type II toxin-antitoxin system RelE/ParE family toxin [Bythopirellula goksoeyrii]QEG35070.1 Plasmid stabilization system protein [Bythopirellula goksoeyrii]